MKSHIYETMIYLDISIYDYMGIDKKYRRLQTKLLTRVIREGRRMWERKRRREITLKKNCLKNDVKMLH